MDELARMDSHMLGDIHAHHGELTTMNSAAGRSPAGGLLAPAGNLGYNMGAGALAVRT